jgi:Zn-dependent M28 family amino/carboxypeptidase
VTSTRLLFAFGAASAAILMLSSWGGSARAAAADASSQTVLARIIGEEAVSQGAYNKLAYLTDRIGARLSGSPGAAAAVSWATQEFRRDGLRATTEKVMVPHWVRGEEAASILSPISRKLVITALGMSIPTPAEGIQGEVLEAGSFDELRALGEKVRGKIVLYYRPMQRHPEGDDYGPSATLRYRGAVEAAKLGAVATLIRSVGTLSARLPHTGAHSYKEGVEKIPAAALAAEDADLIHRLIASGETVRVKLLLGCKLLPDAESANVLGELKGRKHPEEFVVIGGHLDSWDLGTGAIDNGAGVAVSMEALRILKKLNLHPKRTIRAVLFMNEENGGRGGKTYAEAHRKELDRHVAAIESDGGAGSPLGFGVTAGEGALARVAALALALQSVGSAQGVQDGGGGVDTGPMREAGVPLLSLRQDMTYYFDYHHTAADTLDKVDRRDLADNAVALAYMAWSLANLDPPLARIPEDQRHEPER